MSKHSVFVKTEFGVEVLVMAGWDWLMQERWWSILATSGSEVIASSLHSDPVPSIFHLKKALLDYGISIPSKMLSAIEKDAAVNNSASAHVCY